MVLGEEHMRNILRPPPADPTNLPPNPPHPFQKSFSFYFRQRFLKHHWALAAGYATTIYLFMSIDSARNNAQKAAYEKAISEGHSPFGHHQLRLMTSAAIGAAVEGCCAGLHSGNAAQRKSAAGEAMVKLDKMRPTCMNIKGGSTLQWSDWQLRNAAADCVGAVILREKVG